MFSNFNLKRPMAMLILEDMLGWDLNFTLMGCGWRERERERGKNGMGVKSGKKWV